MRTEASVRVVAAPTLWLRWFGRASVFRRTVHLPLHAVSAVVVLLVILAAIGAPVFSPHDPLDVNLREVHQGPSANHWLGTDDVGRDIASRLLYGARVSLQVGFIAVGIAIMAGVPLGLLAGFRGGLVDELIMRVMDAIIVIPALILALGITAALGAGLNQMMSAIGITHIPL